MTTMGTKVDRNAPCYCGSGKKYKSCCEKKDLEALARKQKKTNLMIVGGVLLAAMVAVGVYYLKLQMDKNKPGDFDAIAKCVTQKGYKMYGAYWCTHCIQQKEFLGKSVKYINYVECTPGSDKKVMSKACKEKKIEKFPTWLGPDGEKHETVYRPEELAALTGCPAR